MAALSHSIVALAATGACAAACGRTGAAAVPPPSHPDTALVSLIRPLGDSAGGLDPLVQAIGESRIVLLGENGHGVGQFSSLKVRITQELQQRLGFDVVAIESGYSDCHEADGQLTSRPAIQSFRDCLAYVMEHAEILPLFEYAREVRARGGSLTIAGIDLQAQGATTAARPSRIRDALRSTAPALAGTAAAADSALLAATRSGGDTLPQWLRDHGRAALATLDSAAGRAPSDARWTVATAAALLRRLLIRSEAAERGDSTPAAFYGSRDEWMARTVSWLADSTGRPRKVVVCLHNDHARYGEWASPSGPVTATGALLRRRYRNAAYSVGFFMGQGTVANNSRAVRPMLPVPDGGIEALFAQAGHARALLGLTGGRGSAPHRWSAGGRPYLRNGLVRDSLRPAMEFDALVYVHEVTPPTYRLP